MSPQNCALCIQRLGLGCDFRHHQLCDLDKPLNYLGLFLHLQNIRVDMKFEAPGLLSASKLSFSKLVIFAVINRAPVPCSTLTGSQKNGMLGIWGDVWGHPQVHRDQSPSPRPREEQLERLQAREKKINKFAGRPQLAALNCGCVSSPLPPDTRPSSPLPGARRP